MTNPVAGALVAYAHFAAIFLTLALLVAEVALYGRALSESQRRTLNRVDLAYLAGALAIVATGMLRIFTSAKGAAFYTHNPVFWTKMGLFVLVALLSIPPTMHYLGRYAASYSIIRAYQTAQLAVFFAIPVCATLMARGVGL
jgi:putative membrane protein